LEDGQWSYKTRVGDVGPIAWKDMAIRVPIKNAGESVKIKLEFFPDNLMIDKLNWSSEIIPEDSLQVISCPLLSIQNSDGTLLTDLDLLLSDQDEDFLITYPGQSYHFTYQIKSAAGLQSSVFLSSQGYYIEWLRGNWITGSGNDYNFDMYDINGTISHLKASWLANRTLLENEFFRNRIPLQEDL
jgi:DNA polymerase elongation subunit (family B)